MNVRTSRRTAPRRGPRKALDDDAVKQVCEIIRSWPRAPMTWDSIVAIVAQQQKGGWTRQALSGNPTIADAYARRKDELRKGKTRPSRDPAIDVLQRQVKDLKAEVEGLRAKLSEYEARFVAMIRNASVRGITQEELERALPSIDRKSI